MDTKIAARTWVLIAIAVIVVAAILIYAFFFGPATPPASSGNISYAPAGQLVAGFPSELVINAASSSAADASYRIAYDGNTTQSTATFESPRPMLYLAISYLNWFNANGWKIVSQLPPAASSSVAGIVATDGGATASVTIVPESATSSKVTVSYVTH